MARRNRTHLGGTATTKSAFEPRLLTKQEFGRRLYRLMQEKGWTQSDLARHADLNRAAISTYVNASSLPTPPKLAALAKALGVEPVDLLPNQTGAAIMDDTPDMAFNVSPGNRHVGWLQINRLVTTQTGLKIMELLAADDAADRV